MRGSTLSKTTSRTEGYRTGRGGGEREEEECEHPLTGEEKEKEGVSGA